MAVARAADDLYGYGCRRGFGMVVWYRVPCEPRLHSAVVASGCVGIKIKPGQIVAGCRRVRVVCEPRRTGLSEKVVRTTPVPEVRIFHSRRIRVAPRPVVKSVNSGDRVRLVPGPGPRPWTIVSSAGQFEIEVRQHALGSIAHSSCARYNAVPYVQPGICSPIGGAGTVFVGDKEELVGISEGPYGAAIREWDLVPVHVVLDGDLQRRVRRVVDVAKNEPAFILRNHGRIEPAHDCTARMIE